ncbi:lantibiotic dehydratase [Kitasatospora sp. NPDC059795]|uniref:lantibiotic dehydratase n=1 Tax=Kitasatospora sp. NPDC059795 TaxID=3346949 RepID=UPI003661A2B2
MYRIAGPALVRAASLPAHSVPKWWPGLADEGTGAVETWRRWLAHVAVPEFREVLESTGSGGAMLAQRVSEAVDGAEISTPALRNLVEKVMIHVLARTRPTPTGLLAGVGVARFGDVPVAPRWGAGQVVIRPDTRWLAGMLDEVETLVGDELPVVADPLRVRRGGRVVPADRDGGTEGSVRATGPVLAALNAAGAGAAYTLAELTGHLTREFKHLDTGEARRLVGELLTAGLLTSALRPPMTVVDPLRHVLAVAAETGADRAPAAEPLFAELRYIAQEMDTHNQAASPTMRRVVRGQLTARKAARGVTGPMLTMDLRIDAGPLALPAGVTTLITDAADALVRLSPNPDGDPVWADYRRRFLDNWGPGTVVPLLELVSADTGLGFPAGYRGSVLPDATAGPFGDRDARLLALAQEAAVRGLTEIRLDGPLISTIMPLPAAETMPPHLELTVRLVAAGPPGRHGAPERYGVVVDAQPRPSGTTVGRFLHLLDPGDRAEVEAALRGAPPARADARVVQVSAPPLHTRAANAARVPALLPVLAVGEHPQPGVDTVDAGGIGVCADEQRMWLVSLADGRPIEARVLTAVGLRSSARPMVRFLAEIGTAFHRWPAAFHWGIAASGLPVLPRVVHGRAVLSPARWNLTAADLPGPDTPWEAWKSAARTWLDRYRVPGRVHLSHHGTRLPLDLSVPDHLLLLRNHLAYGNRATLIEAPTPADNEWCGGRTVEITAQLHTTREPLPAARRPARESGSRDWQLPGMSSVLVARLHGNPHRANEVLTRTAELTESPARPATWWFDRAAAPEPHLNLYLLLPDPSAWTDAAERIGEWARTLRLEGLLTRIAFDTYRPHLGQFGRGAALGAAQHVFAADSRAVRAQLAYQHAEQAEPAAVTAASMLRLATALLGPADGRSWLLEHLSDTRMPVPRAVRTNAVELAGQTAVLSTPGEGYVLAQAWQRRAQALTAYRAALLRADGPEPGRVVATLLDDHFARVGGDRAADGRTVQWLTRLCAESLNPTAVEHRSR